jgi:hypothetical protein
MAIPAVAMASTGYGSTCPGIRANCGKIPYVWPPMAVFGDSYWQFSLGNPSHAVQIERPKNLNFDKSVP